MDEITITLKLHVEDEEQMRKDILRVLGSRKALKRLLNSITVIQVGKDEELRSEIKKLEEEILDCPATNYHTTGVW